MPAILRVPIKALLWQFNKRSYGENRGVGDSDGQSPVAIVGLVVAFLTLLLGIASLRSPGFRRWASRLLPSDIVKSFNPEPKALDIALPNSAPTADAGSSAIPITDIPTPDAAFLYSGCYGSHLADAHSDTFLCDHNGITGEHFRAPQVEEEEPGPRRPKRVVTR